MAAMLEEEKEVEEEQKVNKTLNYYFMLILNVLNIISMKM